MKSNFLIVLVVIVAVAIANYVVLAVFNEPTASPPGNNVLPPVINLFTNCNGGCLSDNIDSLRWDATDRPAANWTGAADICANNGARLPRLEELLHHDISVGTDRWTSNISFERTECSGFFCGGSRDVFWVLSALGKRYGAVHPTDIRSFLCVSGL